MPKNNLGMITITAKHFLLPVSDLIALSRCLDIPIQLKTFSFSKKSFNKTTGKTNFKKIFNLNRKGRQTGKPVQCVTIQYRRFVHYYKLTLLKSFSRPTRRVITK